SGIRLPNSSPFEMPARVRGLAVRTAGVVRLETAAVRLIAVTIPSQERTKQYRLASCEAITICGNKCGGLGQAGRMENVRLVRAGARPGRCRRCHRNGH